MKKLTTEERMIINITKEVMNSNAGIGAFIDIPTKFVKSPKWHKLRTIHIKEGKAYFYSYNPYGHKKYSYGKEINLNLPDGYYTIDELEHRHIKGIWTHVLYFIDKNGNKERLDFGTPNEMTLKSIDLQKYAMYENASPSQFVIEEYTGYQPTRIQRKRTRGWRKPEHTVNVGRPSKWGNPHNWQDGLEWGDEQWAKGTAVFLFEKDLTEGNLPYSIEDIKKELKGKNLMCWCKENQPCHGDILLKYANL